MSLASPLSGKFSHPKKLLAISFSLPSCSTESMDKKETLFDPRLDLSTVLLFMGTPPRDTALGIMQVLCHEVWRRLSGPYGREEKTLSPITELPYQNWDAKPNNV